MAVSFRQSNIVWVAFVAAQAVGPILMHAIHVKVLEQPVPIKFSLTMGGQLKELAEGLPLLLRDPWRLLSTAGEVLRTGGGYLLVWMLFVAFVVWNDGVVVGDRSAHVAVFHPAQVLYFCGFALAFSVPFCVTKVRVFLHLFRQHYILAALAAALAVAVVDSYTLAHPYLLADNRHLTFYLWRRVVTATEWSKYALVPTYLFGGFCVLHSLRRSGFILRLTLPPFVAVALAPQLLLEFRYFIVPYLLYRLHVRPTSWWKLWAETALYAAVNAFTVLLFVFKPFRWEHDPSNVQRIIW